LIVQHPEREFIVPGDPQQSASPAAPR
jgi:hypothetical protein